MAAYVSVPPEPMAKKMKKKVMPSKRQREQLMMSEKRREKGFEANAKKISARQGIPMERAEAILAAGARKASPAAKKANPALKRVKGKAKK